MSLPSNTELKAAIKKTLPDLIGPNLKVLFVGINPGLYTAYSGYPYAHPANRFWPTLYKSGFTPRLFKPSESSQMLNLGYGMTNVVARASVSAKELTKEEYILGGKQVLQKIEKYKPQWVAFVGIQAYQIAFGKAKAKVGRQEGLLGSSKIWVLPSPSGLNAHYKPEDFVRIFHDFYQEVIYL